MSQHSRQFKNGSNEPVPIALFQRRGKGRPSLPLRFNEKKNFMRHYARKWSVRCLAVLVLSIKESKNTVAFPHSKKM
jgi:hypothetical protein